MKKTIILAILLFLVACNDKKRNSVEQEKLDFYFMKGSDVNLDKSTRLKFVDSVAVFIENANDSVKTYNYFKIANRYFTLLEYEKYKEITEKVLKISQSNNDSLNIVKAEYYLGDYYFSVSKYDSAYYYYVAAEKKYKTLNDKYNLAHTLLHKAYILLYEKDFLGSESETIKVLDIAKELKDENLIYQCYTNLGSALSGLGDYEKALEYHQKSLLQIKLINDENYKPILQAQTLNNIGFVYQSINKHEEARQFFLEGLKINNLENIQPILYASLLDNYSFSRFKINPKEGLKDFKEALEVNDKIDHVYGRINSRLHLTEYYLTQKDTIRAIEYNKEAYKLAKESKYNKELLATLEFFMKLIPEEGLAYAQEHIKLNDELQKQERATRNKLARIEFETDEIISENEKISSQRKVILSTSLLVFCFGLLFYIILYQRGKHKDLAFKQRQQESNEEIYRLMLSNQDDINEVRNKVKRNISLDLHDNILNRLASTRLNLFAISRKQDEETIKTAIQHIDAIRVIEQEIRAFSHELYNDSVMNKSNFKNIIEELLKSQSDTYDPVCRFSVNYSDAINNMSPEIKMNVYRIIQEAFNNINKYANATKIDLKLDADSQGVLHLDIYDNGVGFNVKKSREGIGLKNMKSRAETIKGQLLVESEKGKGTRINLKVKLN